MRNLILAAAAATTLSLGLGTAGADARPLVVEPAAAPHIVLVSGGCGLAFHRGPYGGCVANRPVVVVRRVVPVFPCHRVWTAFGWRRVCR